MCLNQNIYWSLCQINFTFYYWLITSSPTITFYIMVTQYDKTFHTELR